MPDPQAPEIAAPLIFDDRYWLDDAAKHFERSEHDATTRWQAEQCQERAKAIRRAITPLPIAPQETMRAVFDQELMAAGATVFCGRLRTGKCTAQDMGVIRAVERTVSRLTTLGQSHSPATAERELAEALRRARHILIALDEGEDHCGNTIDTSDEIVAIDKALATASQPVDAEERKCRQCLRIGASLSLVLEVIKRHGLNPPDEANKIMDEVMSTTPPPDRAPVPEEMVSAAWISLTNSDPDFTSSIAAVRDALEAAIAAREAQKGKGNE